MRYLKLHKILSLYQQIIEQSGGSMGVHNLSALKSSLAQPRQTFGGEELYPTLGEKAAALGYFLVKKNHPFVDGNKRLGHAAMEMFLLLNGYEIVASVDEQENIILQIAAGKMRRDTFTGWLQEHLAKS